MSSTRLPGKVLARLNGHSTLGLVLERLGRSRHLAAVVVATSTTGSDDRVAQETEAAGHRVIRGPLDDVLERYRLAARETGADAVVRITADCPLVAPELVDRVVERWLETGGDYVANTVPPRSFPVGLDVELMSAPALERVAAGAQDPGDREHVTTFVHANPALFTREGLWLQPPCPDQRVTLDTASDLEFLRELIARIGSDAPLERILEALGRPPLVVMTTPHSNQ